MAPAKAAAPVAAPFDFDDTKSVDDNLKAFFDSLVADDPELTAALRARLSIPRSPGVERKTEIWDELLEAVTPKPADAGAKP